MTHYLLRFDTFLNKKYESGEPSHPKLIAFSYEMASKIGYPTLHEQLTEKFLVKPHTSLRAKEHGYWFR